MWRRAAPCGQIAQLRSQTAAAAPQDRRLLCLDGALAAGAVCKCVCVFALGVARAGVRA